jgi:hypothetical protein
MRYEYPMWARGIALVVAFVAWLAIRAVFLLPNAALAVVFRFLTAVAQGIGGPSPATRALADLHFVFGSDPKSAAIFRTILTQSAPGELRGIVRGAVLKEML